MFAPVQLVLAVLNLILAVMNHKRRNYDVAAFCTIASIFCFVSNLFESD